MAAEAQIQKQKKEQQPPHDTSLLYKVRAEFASLINLAMDTRGADPLTAAQIAQIREYERLGIKAREHRKEVTEATPTRGHLTPKLANNEYGIEVKNSAAVAAVNLAAMIEDAAGPAGSKALNFTRWIKGMG